MSAQDTNKPNNRVFVGQLSIDVDQAALKEHFAKAGEIFALKVKKYPKKNIAYAFINYVDETSPQKAIDEFNGKNFNGKEIEVQIAKELAQKSNNNNNNNSENRRPKQQGRNRRNNNNNNNNNNKNNNNNQRENNNEKELSQTTLFVSNLPFAYDDEKLKQLFEGYKVKAAHTVSRNGRSKGYGFVEFESEESAKAALEDKNKFNVEDREINVRNAFKYDESVAQKSNSTDTLYVSNLPYKMSDETLNDIFKDYGVVRAYVARTKKGRSKGFGFVVLAGEEAETAAKQEKVISEKNQFKVEDREIYVRPAYLSDRSESSENANNDYNNNNNNNDEPEVKQIALYVSNIPFSVTSDDLVNLFKDVKGFQSANVVIAKKNGRSRGYGFVIFDTEENRDAALAVKSDLKVDDRTLSISIARGKKSTNNNNNSNNNNNRRGNRNNNSNYNNRLRRAGPRRRRGSNNNNNNNNDDDN